MFVKQNSALIIHEVSTMVQVLLVQQAGEIIAGEMFTNEELIYLKNLPN